MMDLSGVRQIQARIAEIEGQFALPKQDLPGADFASKLQQEIERTASVAAGKAYAADRVQQNTAAAAPSAAQKITAAEQGTLANPELARMIHTAAQKYGVDPKLVSAVAEVESGGHQDAVSSTGAVGVMQLMPETAAGLGVYLREMLDTFDGDVKKAVAAYNAGPNAVKAYGGVPPYAETQNYVSNVLDIYH